MARQDRRLASASRSNTRFASTSVLSAACMRPSLARYWWGDTHVQDRFGRVQGAAEGAGQADSRGEDAGQLLHG